MPASSKPSRGKPQQLSAWERDADPLDAAGAAPVNFLTGRAGYTPERREWAAKWSTFPLYAMPGKLRELTRSYARHSVTLIVSGTGSGKTVLAVPLMLKYVMARDGTGHTPTPSSNARVQPADDRPKVVAVTVPKRATALSAAQTGARTLDATLGKEVGYAFRGAPPGAADKRATRLLYATDGAILVHARRDPLLSDYAAIVVDEAHERPVPTDMLLAAVRDALVRRPDMRLVIMSATIDPSLFVAYFRAVGLSTGVVEVAGQPLHPIDRAYLQRDLPDPPNDALPAALDAVRDVLRAETHTLDGPAPAPDAPPTGGIIAFVPTTREATQGCRRFDRRVCKEARACDVVACASLYSRLGGDGIAAALAPVKAPFRRKVIFATNVAESSLTIPGLSTVVDSGLQFTSVWDAATHGARLGKGYASRAQIAQRVGRVGRTAPGKAVLLYTQARHDALPEYPPPAILEVDMTEHLLAALAAPRLQQIQQRGGHAAPPLPDAALSSTSNDSQPVKSKPKSATMTVAEVVRAFERLITPPTAAQVAGALAFARFYGLVEDPPARASHLELPPAPATSSAPAPHVVVGPQTGGAAAAPVKAKRAATRAAPQAKEQGDLPAKPLPGRDEHTTVISAYGRWLLRVSGELKLGIWNALLVCAGIVHGCALDAAILALLFETVGDQTSAMFMPPPNDADGRTQPSPLPSRMVDRGSDHATLLGLCKHVLPRVRESLAWQPSAPGQKRRPLPLVEMEKLDRLRLAAGTWTGIADRLDHDLRRVRRLAEFAERDGVIPQFLALHERLGLLPPPSPGTWINTATTRHSTPAAGGIKGGAAKANNAAKGGVEGGVSALQRALIAARAYHVCARAGPNMASLHVPAAPAPCRPDPMYANVSHPGAAAAVYEQLVHTTTGEGAHRGSASIVTWLPASALPAVTVQRLRTAAPMVPAVAPVVPAANKQKTKRTRR